MCVCCAHRHTAPPSRRGASPAHPSTQQRREDARTALAQKPRCLRRRGPHGQALRQRHAIWVPPRRKALGDSALAVQMTVADQRVDILVHDGGDRIRFLGCRLRSCDPPKRGCIGIAAGNAQSQQNRKPGGDPLQRKIWQHRVSKAGEHLEDSTWHGHRHTTGTPKRLLGAPIYPVSQNRPPRPSLPSLLTWTRR